MKSGPIGKVRCAIYTRVSTDQGLDQDFNSLDAGIGLAFDVGRRCLVLRSVDPPE
jgi:hypothetical protein